MNSTLAWELGFWGLAFGCLPTEAAPMQQTVAACLEETGWKAEKISVFLSAFRLGLLIEGITDKEGGTVVEVRGPKAAMAYDLNRLPTPALAGFAARLGIEPGELYIKEIDGEKFIFGQKAGKAREVREHLPEMLTTLLTRLPWKDAEWKKGSRFPQPPLYALSVLDDTVLPFPAGFPVGRETWVRGGEAVKRVALTNAAEYPQVLAAEHIAFLPADRRKAMEMQIQSLCGSGENIRKDAEILDRLSFHLEDPAPFVFPVSSDILRLPPPLYFRVLADMHGGLPFETSKGEVLPKVVGFADHRLTSIHEGRVREEVLLEKATELLGLLTQETERDRAAFYEDLKDFPSRTRASLYEEAQDVFLMAQNLFRKIHPQDEEPPLEQIVFELFAGKCSHGGRRYPELAPFFAAHRLRGQDIPAGVPDAIFEAAMALESRESSLRSPAGRVVALAAALFQVIEDRQGPAETRKALGAKVVKLLIEGRLSLDLVKDLQFMKKNLPAREFWIELFFANPQYRDKESGAFTWVLAGGGFDPAIVAEALESWESEPPEAEMFRALIRKILGKMSDREVLSAMNAGFSPQESALDARLKTLETAPVFPLKKFLARLVEARAEIEACLMDLPPQLDEGDPCQAVRILLLKRVVTQASRVRFLTPDPASQKRNPPQKEEK